MESRGNVWLDGARKAVASARECLGNGLAAISRPDPDYRAAMPWFAMAEHAASEAKRLTNKGWFV